MTLKGYLVWRAPDTGTEHTNGRPFTGTTVEMGGAPLQVLKKRYASGEITKEEFDQMKKDLEDSG